MAVMVVVVGLVVGRLDGGVLVGTGAGAGVASAERGCLARGRGVGDVLLLELMVGCFFAYTLQDWRL